MTATPTDAEAALYITLRDAMPTVRQDKEHGHFEVWFETAGQGTLVARLTPTALQTLALQCLAVMPEIEPKYTVASIEEAYRQPARILKQYDDRAIQLLLREVSSDTLINFLWYMKDRELIMKVVNNLSTRAGEALVQDLDETWHGKNPDTALEAHAKAGREAVLSVMALLRKLIDEGQFHNLLGASSQAQSKHEPVQDLTVEEVDALLKGKPETRGGA